MNESKKRTVHLPEFKAKVGLERGPQPVAPHNAPERLYGEIGR